MSNHTQLVFKLRNLAAKHANSIYAKRDMSKIVLCPTSNGKPTKHKSYLVVCPDYRDTIDILDEGDTETIAARVQWYLFNFPKFFDGETLCKTSEQ